MESLNNEDTKDGKRKAPLGNFSSGGTHKGVGMR